MLPSSRNSSKSIRQGIKATVGQLDRWDSDQIDQHRRREAANASFPHGYTDRLALAKHRARISTSVDKSSSHVKGGSIYCHWCDSDEHSTETCVVKQDSPEPLKTLSEDPSSGIHRAIVHRLYRQACDLYLLTYPSFFPGVEATKADDPEAKLSSVKSSPDYYTLAISQATDDLHQASLDSQPSTDNNLFLICRLYYSKSFPSTFTDFCEEVSSRQR